MPNADFTMRADLLVNPILQAMQVLSKGQQIRMASTQALREMGGFGQGVFGPIGAQAAPSAGAGVTPGTGSEAFAAGVLELADMFKEAETAAGSFKKQKDKVDRNMKKTAKTTKGFADRVSQLGGKLRSLSRLFFYASLDMMSFANVVLGPMRQGLVVFEEYNRTMTQMWVNFQFLSQNGDAALSLLSERFQELSDTTEFSRLAIARAAAVFGTAGVAIDDVSESLEEMASLARINFTEMDKVAQLTLSIMRRFRLTLEDATGEMWRLTAMAQLTGESIFDVANQMGYASEFGLALGYSFGEIAAQMTLMTEVYGSASIAGRRLSSVYARLLEQGEEYGIQLRDTNGEMLKSRDHISGLVDYLDLIADPIEQSQYLMALFGATGAATARTLIEAFKAGKLDEVMEDTSDAMVDTMRNLSDVIKNELYVSMQDLRSAVEDLHLAIGEDLAVTLKELLPPITEAVTALSGWIKANKDTVITIGAIALAVAALATVMRTIGFAIEIFVALTAIVGALSTAWYFLSAGLALVGFTIMPALTSGLAAFVVGLTAVLAVIGLVIAVILIITGFLKAWDDQMKKLHKDLSIFASLSKLVNGILSIFASLIKIVVGFIVLFGMALFAVGEAIADLFMKIPFLRELLAGLAWIFSIIAEAVNIIAKALAWLGDAIWGTIESLMPKSPSLADRFFELGEAINSTLDPMKSATTWGRRMTNSIGNVKREVALSYGRATAGALGASGGQGTTVITTVDAAQTIDPEQLADIIAERQVQNARKYYRSTPY